MIIDHRTYTVRHGGMADYLHRFETVALPIQLRHLGKLVGTFVSDIGPMNEVIHIWQYDDIADRERRRAAMQADPEWIAFVESNAGTFVAQQNKIMKPAPFSSLR